MKTEFSIIDHFETEEGYLVQLEHKDILIDLIELDNYIESEGLNIETLNTEIGGEHAQTSYRVPLDEYAITDFDIECYLRDNKELL